jgi:hypothetical protein
MSYRSMHSILTQGLDQVPIAAVAAATHLPPTHDNVRGAAYYAAPADQLSLITGDV